MVYQGAGFSTSMAGQLFWDEDGRRHNHDPNTTTWSFRCSNGHEWSVTQPHNCPVEGCEWKRAMTDACRDTEPTAALEREVAVAICQAVIDGLDWGTERAFADQVARVAIGACFRPRPMSSAPDDGTMILLYGRVFERVDWHKARWSGDFQGDTRRYWQSSSPGVVAVVHEPKGWLPLPPPPEGET